MTLSTAKIIECLLQGCLKTENTQVKVQLEPENNTWQYTMYKVGMNDYSSEILLTKLPYWHVSQVVMQIWFHNCNHLYL